MHLVVNELALMKDIKGFLLYKTADKQGILFTDLSFYKINLETGNRELVARLPVGGKKRFLSKYRITNRLLRLDPRASVQVDNHRFLVSVLHKVWLLDVEKKTLEPVFNSRKNFSDNLNFCEYNGKVYWGDYGVNVVHEPINIYEMNQDGKVRIVYTFPQGDVIHVHNIFLDENRSKFWVLMGDNEEKAGIYTANLDWKEVKPIKVGKQIYRSVVGFPYKGGLLYATDSVDYDNYLRLIEVDGAEKVLAPINGSCIYGGETKDNFLFSTTVEPRAGAGFKHIFENRLGGGIKSWEVHIIAVSKKDLSIRTVKTLRKDWLPMVLFQYGRVRFAGGQENTNTIWCSPVACKKYDGKTIKIDL